MGESYLFNASWLRGFYINRKDPVFGKNFFENQLFQLLPKTEMTFKAIE